MLNEVTINKLIEMRLTTMADAYRNQIQDSSLFGVSFEDRFGMLVDREYSSRKSNRLRRLIKRAAFDQPQACLADLNYHSGRKLDKKLIDRLSTCDYVKEQHNIIILGATGAGKSFMACVFGMEAARTAYRRHWNQSLDCLEPTARTHWFRTPEYSLI